ncbi:hypothetical protein B7W89_12740 [Agrobacterium tumefaciens]|nr:hypothetical protein B7W89_12740 [Agrobacterium tumefaciens]
MRGQAPCLCGEGRWRGCAGQSGLHCRGGDGGGTRGVTDARRVSSALAKRGSISASAYEASPPSALPGISPSRREISRRHYHHFIRKC